MPTSPAAISQRGPDDNQTIDGKIQKNGTTSQGGSMDRLSLPGRIKLTAYSEHMADRACLTYLPTYKALSEINRNCPECPTYIYHENMGFLPPANCPKTTTKKSVRSFPNRRCPSMPRRRSTRPRPRPRSALVRHIRRQSPFCFLRVLTSSFVMHSGSGLEFSRSGGSTRPSRPSTTAPSSILVAENQPTHPLHSLARDRAPAFSYSNAICLRART